MVSHWKNSMISVKNTFRNLSISAVIYKYAMRNRKKENSFLPVCSKNTCKMPITKPMPAILSKSVNSIRSAPHATTYAGQVWDMYEKGYLEVGRKLNCLRPTFQVYDQLISLYERLFEFTTNSYCFTTDFPDLRSTYLTLRPTLIEV